MEFELGDIVKWTSQAGGRVKHKQGQVVHIVPPKMSPDKDYHRLINLNRWKSRWGYGLSRKEESYLVLVLDPPRLPSLYWPRTSLLHKIGHEPLPQIRRTPHDQRP